jgi:hypothetical protein
VNTTGDVKRPTRKAARVDFKALLALEDLESEKSFEKYAQMVRNSFNECFPGANPTTSEAGSLKKLELRHSSKFELS